MTETMGVTYSQILVGYHLATYYTNSADSTVVLVPAQPPK
jgi:hypothetical protein